MMAHFWDGDGRAVRFHERPDVREERNPTLATMRLSRTWGTRANGGLRCAQNDKRFGMTTKKQLRLQRQKNSCDCKLQKSRWSSNRVISSSSARGQGRLRWGR